MLWLALLQLLFAAGLVLPWPRSWGDPAGWPWAAWIPIAAGALLHGWSVLSLRSVRMGAAAAAGEVVRRGPYRLVRHPMYLGLALATAGTAWGYGSPWRWLLWVGLLVVLLAKAHREERHLIEELPGYAAYRQETAALLPGLW